MIYEPTFGIANFFTEKLIGQRFDFLGNKDLAFGATIAVDVWMWTPFMILMTLAALGSVPKAELEAAEIDQIPWLKRIWYIILPNGKFILMLGILLRTIDAFKTTDLALSDDQRRAGEPHRVRRALPLPHRVRGVPDG